MLFAAAAAEGRRLGGAGTPASASAAATATAATRRGDSVSGPFARAGLAANATAAATAVTGRGVSGSSGGSGGGVDYWGFLRMLVAVAERCTSRLRRDAAALDAAMASRDDAAPTDAAGDEFDDDGSDDDNGWGALQRPASSGVGSRSAVTATLPPVPAAAQLSHDVSHAEAVAALRAMLQVDHSATSSAEIALKAPAVRVIAALAFGRLLSTRVLPLARSWRVNAWRDVAATLHDARTSASKPIQASRAAAVSGADVLVAAAPALELLWGYFTGGADAFGSGGSVAAARAPSTAHVAGTAHHRAMRDTAALHATQGVAHAAQRQRSAQGARSGDAAATSEHPPLLMDQTHAVAASSATSRGAVMQAADAATTADGSRSTHLDGSFDDEVDREASGDIDSSRAATASAAHGGVTGATAVGAATSPEELKAYMELRAYMDAVRTAAAASRRVQYESAPAPATAAAAGAAGLLVHAAVDDEGAPPPPPPPPRDVATGTQLPTANDAVLPMATVSRGATLRVTASSVGSGRSANAAAASPLQASLLQPLAPVQQAQPP